MILLGQTRFCKNRVYCHKNNVGYNTADKVGQQFVGLGGCFVSVGAESTFKLGDITLTGSNSGVDFLQQLDLATANVNESFYIL